MYNIDLWTQNDIYAISQAVFQVEVKSLLKKIIYKLQEHKNNKIIQVNKAVYSNNKGEPSHCTIIKIYNF